MKTYPIFLVHLAGRRTLVLGGGSEAERKTRELIDCDATVTVIAATMTRGLLELWGEGRIVWIARDYCAGDLRGAFLAISAVAERGANVEIALEARREGVLLNAMDDPDRCDFIAGALVRRGPLTIGISTGGAAPALAVRLRERFEKELGPEYGTLTERLGRLRETMLQRYPDFERRRRAWYDLVDRMETDLLSPPVPGSPPEDPGSVARGVRSAKPRV